MAESSPQSSPLDSKSRWAVTSTPKTILRQISLADPVPFKLDQDLIEPLPSVTSKLKEASFEIHDLSIEDEDPPEMLDSDSDGTVDNYDSSIDNERQSSDVSFEINYPSSPDISICDSTDLRDSPREPPR